MKLVDFSVKLIDGAIAEITAKGWNMPFQISNYALPVNNRFTGEFLGYKFFGVYGTFLIDHNGRILESDHEDPNGALATLGWLVED